MNTMPIYRQGGGHTPSTKSSNNCRVANRNNTNPTNSNNNIGFRCVRNSEAPPESGNDSDPTAVLSVVQAVCHGKTKTPGRGNRARRCGVESSGREMFALR